MNMRRLTALIAWLAVVAVYIGPRAEAQGFATGGAAYTDAQAQAAVASLIPQASTAVPPSPTPTGVAGSGMTYTPANAAAPSLNRSTTAVTLADGTFSITWATPLASATPPVNVIPINAGSQPIVCNITSRNAATVAGKCWMNQTTLLSLSIITAGLTLNPTTASAAGINVMVVAREPTQ